MGDEQLSIRSCSAFQTSGDIQASWKLRFVACPCTVRWTTDLGSCPWHKHHHSQHSTIIWPARKFNHWSADAGPLTVVDATLNCVLGGTGSHGRRTPRTTGDVMWSNLWYVSIVLNSCESCSYWLWWRHPEMFRTSFPDYTTVSGWTSIVQFRYLDHIKFLFFDWLTDWSIEVMQFYCDIRRWGRRTK